ncbi:MAG: hypothetical protein AB1634_06225 [Thermodesulfobacteriota bacterium]
MASVLAVVVARKGSKGLPSKCMLPIGKMPVVEHVLAWCQGLSTPELAVTTVLSTDIPEAEPLCGRHGALFLPRPAELAGDRTRIEEVLFHAWQEAGQGADYLLLVYGNIPVRHAELVQGPVCFLAERPEFDAVFTFQPVEKFNPAWMVDVCEDELPDWPAAAFRRQDLKPYMIHDGHTVLTRASYFASFWPEEASRRQGRMYESFGRRIKPWLHDRLVIDIDAERDYLLARAVLLCPDLPSGLVGRPRGADWATTGGRPCGVNPDGNGERLPGGKEVR